MSSNKKQASGKSYLKLIGIMLVGAVFGGIVGALSVVANSAVDNTVEVILQWLGASSIWFFWIMLVGTTIYGILLYRHMSAIGTKIRAAEEKDEDADELEYTMSKHFSIFMIVYYVIILLGMFLISVYMDGAFSRSGRMGIFQILGIYLLVILIQSVIQVRLIRLLQKLDPMKKGDPGDLSFAKDWMESCDEGEREIIYQSAYQTYKITNVAVILMATAAFVCHMMWDTGLFAVALLAFLGIVQVIVYQVNTLRLQKKKLRG